MFTGSCRYRVLITQLTKTSTTTTTSTTNTFTYRQVINNLHIISWLRPITTRHYYRPSANHCQQSAGFSTLHKHHQQIICIVHRTKRKICNCQNVRQYFTQNCLPPAYHLKNHRQPNCCAITIRPMTWPNCIFWPSSTIKSESLYAGNDYLVWLWNAVSF